MQVNNQIIIILFYYVKNFRFCETKSRLKSDKLVKIIFTMTYAFIPLEYQVTTKNVKRYCQVNCMFTLL